MKAPFKIVQKIVKSCPDELGSIEFVYLFLNSPKIPFSYFEKKGFSLGEMPKTNSPLFLLYFLKKNGKLHLLQDMGDYLLLPKGDKKNEV